MKEQIGNFWSQKAYGSALCLPTDGYVKKNGKAVLGRGILAQAKHQFKNIDTVLGKKLINQGRVPGNKGADLGIGNHVTAIWADPWVLTFPIKWVFWESADLQLIERSAIELTKLVDSVRLRKVFLPPIQDGLEFEEVRDTLNRYLDNRFVMVFPKDEVSQHAAY